MLPFTDAQKCACDISRNIAVTAGAGSGKTSVLVERYLWCLENNGYQVRRIVAITFTEKAAGQMLSRIRARVIERAQGSGDPGRWEEVLEKLPLANIATIHSFCQRLLREFPIEAGVDPHFEVFDEAAKRLCLNHLIETVIQQRAAAYDANLTRLADLWPAAALRNVLLRLIAFRETSLPWADRILQETLPNYSNHLRTLLETLQRRGVRQIATDPRWQETMQLLRTLPPAGDNSKLTGRCLNLLDYDSQFRAQTHLEEQLTTLAMLRQDCRMVTPSKKWQEDGRNVRLAEAFNQLKRLYDQYLPPFAVQAELEESGFELQQALAELLRAVSAAYQQEKTARRVLDFDDLQERALSLLAQPAIHAMLAQRYDYLMVDEFQDTNQMQWNLIKQLGTTAEGLAQDKFCIVGDEKQSIYMFRGAEVAVFGAVRRALRQANDEHQLLTTPLKLPPFGEMPSMQAPPTGELILAENFRSLPPLIFFLNALFARIFLPAPDPERPYEIQHQELIAGRKVSSSPHLSPTPSPKGRGVSASLPFGEGVGERLNTDPVEFLFVHAPEENALEQPHLDEPELVAARVAELAQTRNYADIAILLRTRTRLKDFEQALRRREIPFVVAGGIGFYQQQEIYDLVNLLRVLVDSRQDIAFAGALRSPLLSFSDDQLLYLAVGEKDAGKKAAVSDLASPFEAVPFDSAPFDSAPFDSAPFDSAPFDSAQGDGEPFILSEACPERSRRVEGRTIAKASLWEKLARCANALEAIPAELDPPKFLHTHTLLHSWKAQAGRIAITHLLRRILDDTGFYGMLAGGPREIQSRINIEKLLDIARTLEGVGFQTLSDFVAYLELLIELEEREGEAQVNFEGMNAVRVMTIHAAKGLEFPVVFVPELERPFNYGVNEPVYLDTLKAEHGGLPAVGLKGFDPAKNYARDDTFLREYLRRLNAEKTDAEMKRLLYVACTRAKDQLVLSGAFAESVAPNSWLAWLRDIFPLQAALAERRFCLEELTIPIRTSADYEKRSSLPGMSAAFPGEPENSPPGRGQGWVNGVMEAPGTTEPTPPPPRRGIREILTSVNDPSQQGQRIDSDVFETLRQNLSPLGGGANEIVRINPSTVHTLWQCPRKYYYREILKLPEFLEAQAENETAAEPLPEIMGTGEPFRQGRKNRGTIIHRLFEKQVFDQYLSETDLLASLENVLDEFRISAAEREEMRLIEAIHRAHRHYAQSGLRELLARSSRIYREYPFALRLGRAELSGTIDVLCYDPQEAAWIILDYKSNEIEIAQVGEEITRHGYDLQIQMYALAVSRLLRTTSLRSLLFFTFPGCVYDAVDLSPAALQAREQHIAAFLDRLAAGVIECAPQPSCCEECAYQRDGVCCDEPLPLCPPLLN